MATVKITDLPYITSLQPNTANTVLVGVDIPSDDTGQITLTTLATGLYSNNRLVVGNYSTVYPNAITTFANTSNNYVQSILENTDDDGTSDWVAQANVSTDTTYYIDLGFTGNNYNNLNPYNSLGTSIQPLDGYLYVQGLDGSKGGNLVVGTTSTNTLINFIVGGVNAENVVAYMTPSGIYSPSINSLVAANVSTLNASITANAASANAVINSRISSNIATANAFTQAAFDKANNALANTSGTFAGNLSITGNVVVNGQTSSTGPITTGNLIVNGTSSFTGNVTMDATTYLTGAVTVNSTMILANSNFNSTEAALTITASGNTVVPANDGYMIHISGKNGVPSRVVTDSYGTAAYALFAGRAARGTVDSPTALANNDVIARYSSSGYGTTKYQTFGVGRIDFVASENYTDANTGSRIEFWNCPVGSNTLNKIATFNGDSVSFSGVVSPVKGFIYTPRILTGAQTAITIDFAEDSMIRATFNSSLNITHTNYTYGKIVEMWLTNTAGNGQTVTHGCLANNATTGSATLSVAAGRSAKLQYFSIDGDLSNTFVAITYA